MTRITPEARKYAIPRKHWTQDEVTYLVKHWGATPLKSLAARLGRPPRAVQAKAIGLKLGAANKGLKTPYTLEREWGYDRERIVKAMRKLGIRMRVGLNGSSSTGLAKRRYIDDDRLPELEAFLARTPDGERIYAPEGKKTGRFDWGTGGKPPTCRRCARTDRAHYANGFCAPCAKHLERRKKQEAFQGNTLAYWELMLDRAANMATVLAQ